MDTTHQVIIRQHLPEALREKAMKFNINPEYIQTQKELVVLILQSRSIGTNEEKQSWFDLLSLMNEEQTIKLHDILTREKEKLEEIEKKYEEKKIAIKKKYLLKWQNMGYQKNMSKIKAKEGASREKEEAEADDLLKNI